MNLRSVLRWDSSGTGSQEMEALMPENTSSTNLGKIGEIDQIQLDEFKRVLQEGMECSKREN